MIATAGIVAAAVYHFPPQWWWRWGLYAFISLFAWGFGSIFRKSLGAQNWLLAYDGGSVTIKFRSFLNAHYPLADVVIVTVTRREIAWLRRTKERVTTQGSEGTESRTSYFLDIGLADGVDTAPLAEALKAERRDPPGTWSRTRWHDQPLRLVEDGRVLRVTWASQASSVTPSLNKTLRQLSSLAPVREQLSRDADYTKPASDQAAKETQIIELIERGEQIAAVKLAKKLYGVSLTQPNKFVEELQTRK
jgi:hypothetical protein